MLDLTVARITAGLVFIAAVLGLALVGRSVISDRSRAPRVLAAREPARFTEPAWLGLTLVVQLWSLGVILLPAWFYGWPSGGDLPYGAFVQGVGLGLWFLGGGLALWAGRTLGRFMTPAIQISEGQPLVQGGPYARMRHPTYTANMMVAFGLGLAFLSPPLLAVAVVLAALARYRAGLEETLLRSPEAFGAAYEAYMARTGRFLPRGRGPGP